MTSKSRRGLAGLILSGALALGATQAAGQTLGDALAAAYQNSNLLAQNRAVLRAADEDIAQAVARLRPVVNFIASADQRLADQRTADGPFEEIGAQPPSGPARLRSTERAASLRLNLDITIFDFGRTDAEIGAAEETVRATRQALVGVEQGVLFNAVSAYMQLRSAAETVTLRQNNLELIEEELRAARDRFEVGEITRTDVAIAESALAAARADLAAAEGDRTVAREFYQLAVGETPGPLAVPPARPQTADTLETAQAIARQTHPDIRSAQHEVAAAEFGVDIARAARRGEVTAGADVGIRFQHGSAAQGANPRRDMGVSLGYTRQIYSGGAQSSRERQAVARRDQSRSQLHQTTLEVLQDVGAAWSDVNVSAARIEAIEQQIEAARQAFEGVSEEARLGARTTLDVLDAEQDLLDARAALIEAEAGRQTATYGLLAAMGLLTVDHLNLGIPTYDPDVYYERVREAPRTSRGDRLDRALEGIGRN